MDIILCPDPSLSLGKGSGGYRVFSWLYQSWLGKPIAIESLLHDFASHCITQYAFAYIAAWALHNIMVK